MPSHAPNLLRLFAFAALFVVLAASLAGAEEAKKRLLIVGQDRDVHHAPTSHEYMAGVRVMEALLRQQPGVEVTVTKAEEPWAEGPALIKQADGVVLYVLEAAKLIAQDPRRQDAMAGLIERGGGFVGLHWGIGAKDEQYREPFLHWLGGMHNGADRKYRHGEFDIAPVEPRHAVATGIGPLHVRDEFYYDLKFVEPAAAVTPVMQVMIDGQPQTVGWVYERPDGGRSFGFSGLHYHATWKLPEYRRLVTQGILWTLKMPTPQGGVNVDVPEGVYELK